MQRVWITDSAWLGHLTSLRPASGSRRLRSLSTPPEACSHFGHEVGFARAVCAVLAVRAQSATAPTLGTARWPSRATRLWPTPWRGRRARIAAAAVARRTEDGG
eukprot:6129090-Pleurochrysis_carterae.AAC.1